MSDKINERHISRSAYVYIRERGHILPTFSKIGKSTIAITLYSGGKWK